MVIAVLTGTGDGPLDVRRMPCSYTSNLSKTLVRLPRKLLGTPSARDALEAMTFGDRNAVDHLILFEDRPNVDRLLEETFAEVDFVRYRSSVDLDLHQMSLLLLERCLANLGVRQDTDNRAILLDTFEFSVDGLARALGVLFGVLGEGLLLGFVPVLIEATFELVAEMLGPDGSQGSQAAGGFDVSNYTDDDHL